MNTLIIKVLAFLLTIFPSCGMLLTPYQSLMFPGEAIVTENIMNAFKTRDVAALEAMMSPESEKTMEDLPGNIGAIIDAIDGEITRYSRSGSYGYDEADFGIRISRTSWSLVIITATESYWLSISWVVINNRAPEKVGMSNLSLLDANGNELATTYHPRT